MIRKWKKFPFSWLLPVLFFAALWLLGTTGIYNDSNQYIAMHIHREPLYSFFLWIFRSLFGETKYLDIVRFLQNGLAAFSVIWLAESLKKRFDFGQWMEALVCLILLAPHIITPVFSASGLVLSNGVISEALGLPLFYLFTAQCMKMVYTRQRGAALSSLLLSLFLSLVRGQMMFTILLWLVFAGAVVIVEKKKLAKRLLICVVCTALAAKLVCADGVPRLYRAGCPCMEEKSQFQRGLAGGIFLAGCVSKRICYLHDHHVPFPLCDLWIAAVLCQRTDAFVRTGGWKNRASTAISSPAPFAKSQLRCFPLLRSSLLLISRRSLCSFPQADFHASMKSAHRKPQVNLNID